MAIVYCSWATGSDTTGDGSAGNPYKTITKASTGLTGGDEVRVAKSPDPTALTGTTAWTLNGTTVTGADTLFTSELAIGDFISAPDGNWYEVITITSDTAATLFKVYPSATQSGYSSKKLGVTDTGAAAAWNTVVQEVKSSGTGSANLIISGGWDLSTQQQTGQTYFRQMHTTFSTRTGFGLYVYAIFNTLISRLHFLRYDCGIYYNNGSSNNIFISPTCNSVNDVGIAYNSCHNNIIISPTCNSNNYGIYFVNYSNNNVLISPTCKSNNRNGIYFGYGSSNNISYGTVTTAYNGSSIYNDRNVNRIAKANIAETTKFTGALDYVNSRLFIDDLNGTGNAYIYTDNGNIQSRNATAGGTGKEWVLSPTSNKRGAKYPLNLSVAKVAVAGSGQVTVKVYFKKTGTGVAGALRVRYGQINWSNDAEDIIVNCPDNTNRNQVTLQFTPTEAGVVEIEALAWYVSSTTQSVIVDDIEITQA